MFSLLCSSSDHHCWFGFPTICGGGYLRPWPNPALQPTVLAFGIALPSQRCALFGAAELDR